MHKVSNSPELQFQTLECPDATIYQIIMIAKDLQKSSRRIEKIVKSCWDNALKLPTGHHILRACKECLNLPQTSETVRRTKNWTLLMQDGLDVSLPAYCKVALSKDSAYFKELFDKANDANLVVCEKSDESFRELLDAWMENSRPKDFTEAYTILKAGVPFKLSPEKTEEVFIDEVKKWSSNEQEFELRINVAREMRLSPSKKIKKVLAQFLADSYLDSERETTQAKCSGLLGFLEPSVLAVDSHGLSVRVKFLQLAAKLRQTRWHVTNREGVADYDKSQPSLVHCRSIYSLDAGGGGDGLAEIIPSLAKSPSFTKLDVSDCVSLTDKEIISLSESQSLTSLNISGCRNITDESLTILARSHIKILDLSYCKKLTDKGIVELAKSHYLTDLDINNCKNITNQGIIPLVKSATIAFLNISYCPKLTDEGLAPFSKNPNLTIIKVV